MYNFKSLADLSAQGFSPCFIYGNRPVTDKNVNSKMESVKKYGVIIPLMYVKGTKAVTDGCSLVEIDGVTPIEATKAENYSAIIDGQNRYTAALKAGVAPDKIFLFECYSDHNTKDLLAEANIEVEGWKGSNFINGAMLSKPDDKLLQLAKKLSDDKFSMSTISKIISFDKSVKITAKVYADIMKGAPIKEYNLEKSNCFLEAASKFTKSFVAKRYLIDSIIDLSIEDGYKPVCEALGRLTGETIKAIEKCKGEAIITEIKAAVMYELKK